MCLLRGTNSGVAAVAASSVETMVMVSLLASSRSSRGLRAQQAGRIERYPEQRNIRLNGLRELISRSVDRIDAKTAQSLDDRGIAADHGQRLEQVFDDRPRRSRRCEIGVPTGHGEAGDRFSHGRNIRELRRTLCGRHREEASLANSYRFNDVGNIAKKHLDCPRQ